MQYYTISINDKGDCKTLKRVLTLTLAVAIVAGGYMFEANGAGEQPSKQAPSISEINIYTPKELNARQKDLVEIGRYTASGDQGALKSVIASAIERGTLTPQEVSIAIRQLYSAAGLKTNECCFSYILINYVMNALSLAMSTKNWFQSKQDLVLYWGMALMGHL